MTEDITLTTTDALIDLVGDMFGPAPTPLHRPVFEGNERAYLVDTIDSNFVSSVGARVTEFEDRIAEFTGCARAVATMNGTAALHMALLVAGVRPGDEVISQALTFVATCNAISYIGARPVFVDVDRDTMSMGPSALRRWLEANTRRDGADTVNRRTGARIAACVPMHTFGLPGRIAEIADICDEFGINLVEDAAESLGSYVGPRHTGKFGKLATLSFNGNKIITTGGGGMIVTDDHALADRAKHLTTTAKVPHKWEFVHDEVGYNYRLPNLNAALGCAQMEKLPAMLRIKADIAARYRAFCAEHDLHFVDPINGTTANFWLNAVRLTDRNARDTFLDYTNARGVMTRPIWQLMSELNAFADCQTDGLETSRWLADRIVNLPSSVPENEFHRLAT
ncbi:LegC family aminotransferase [Roseovarius sp. MBR-6]|jgi:aminotransferase in exopolysaccharide biosynthesis|uniref:LegC family aminotransferase n=1 Tax=Roseovarius sp. MBR-6 TaxID=3156459 RepID=UPI003399D581